MFAPPRGKNILSEKSCIDKISYSSTTMMLGCCSYQLLGQWSVMIVASAKGKKQTGEMILNFSEVQRT